MAKGHLKWVSGVLSAAVISSMFALPQFSHAEGKMNLEEELLNAKKRQIMRVVEEQHDEKLADYKKTRESSVTSGARTATAATTEDATEVTYTGNIQMYEFHDYFFEVKTGGTLKVETALPEEPYMITNLETGDVYSNGQAIPAGTYSLTVFGETDTAQSYSIKISGVTFNGTPNTSLPSVDVSSPAQKETRLPKGTKTLTFEGSVTGATEADYTVNDGQPEVVELVDGKGSFSKSVTLNYGQNGISISAVNESLNSVFEGYLVTAPGIQRIDGQDRYIVSANTGKHLPVLSDTVVIARGDLFPDALSGVPLASVEGAPVLLTKPTALSTAVKDEIKRRGATRAIILGSSGAVSANVESELKSLGVTTIQRQAGADRYETSAKIAQALVNAEKELGFATDTAIIASGQNFPDALAGSSPGGVLGAPVLLVKYDSIPATIEQFIKNNGIKNFVIVGGTGVVSTSVQSKLSSYGGDVVRLGGATRYDTALEVAKFFTANGALNPSVQVVARGDNFPDALSGGPLASFMGSPIVLTTPTSLPSSVANYESQVSPDAFYIMGGTGAVSTSVESKLDSYIK